jgi:serine-type D-Ala-D-Ala carboxypeptidase/endopeptidase
VRATLALLAFISQVASAEPPADTTAARHWSIPPNAEIRAVMAGRLTIRGAGMVVGVIEPTGRRVVAYGESGSPDGRPLDGDTIFQIGSVTKTFTTLLLAEAAHRGEVRLDDDAASYLPRGMTLRERGRAITLLDLATHVSGLPSMPSNFDLRGRPDPISAYSQHDLENFLRTYQPEHAPGEKWQYSNLGVSLLGRLLAERAGTSYEALLRKRVLDPLGLAGTGIHLSHAMAARVAPGLDRYGERADVWEMNTLQASGSLRSSANDLLEYLAAILGYRETSLRAAIDLQLAERSPTRETQALGWGLARFDGREIFAHDGGKPGYRSMLAFDPARRCGVVLLVNARTDEKLGVIALWLINGKPLPPAPRPLASRPRVAVDRATLAAYEGRYRFDDGRELAIVRQRYRLVVGTQSDGPAPFVAASSREFFDPSGTAELEFAQVGQADSLTFYEEGRGKGHGVAGHRVPAVR